LFYASVIAGSTTVSATSALFIEMSCDNAYPVGEGLVSGFLGMFVNFGAAVFLAIDQSFSVGKYTQNKGFKKVCVCGSGAFALN